jgi:hypothetical protein
MERLRLSRELPKSLNLKLRAPTSGAWFEPPSWEMQPMVSHKQLGANHQNAHQSTGPKTAEGVQAKLVNKRFIEALGG